MKKALFAALCSVLALSACKKIETEVKVTGVSVSPATLSLVEGDSEQLRATVTPSDAANKAVSWTSSATAVATVDNTGKVTAVNAGSATITVKTADGGKTATCAVTVTAKVIPVTGISIDQGATAEVEEGNTITLTATVQPDNATDKTVTWVSAHESIATVVDGVVTGIAPGQAIISAKAGDKTATCTVTVNSAIPAYEAVDLGLSVKWANKNLGAEFPEDAGDYYAWGELETKPVYSWNSYKFLTAEGGYISKYTMDAWEAATVDYLTLLEEEDDVAHKILGDKWRLPTPAEWNELHNHTNRQNSQNGMYAKASNGNSIFLPYGGMYNSNDGAELYLKGREGFYWTSSLGNINSYARCAWLAGGDINMSIYIVRSAGLSIRAVYGERPPMPVGYVGLDNTSWEMYPEDQFTLVATVLPESAADKTVTWTSSKPEVATVDGGVVTGVAPGEAVITAKAGDKTATCTVTVNSAIPAYEAVDLGLSVKWANKNLGAEFPENTGDYYAWGETEPKQEFSWDNYKWYDGSAITKYNLTDGFSTLLPEDDAANAALGGQWRLPLDEEFKELVTQCTWIQEGDGTVVKGPNGNTIYIPLTGCMDNEVRYADHGFYWTTTLSSEVYYSLCYGGSGYYSYEVGWADKFYGMAVRPVYGELPHATSVKLNKSQATRYAGGVLQLKANVYPAQAINKSVSWSSSNEGVATVDANGRVTVLAEGEAIITATTMDGGLTAQCKLTVNPIPDGAVFSADAFNSSTGEEPLLILQQDLSNSTVYIRKSSGTIDFNGHTVKYLYMQNNDPHKVVGLCNGIISGRLDGDAGWYRYTGQTFHGKVMMEDMEVYKEFYTDGHVYTLNSGYYETVCTFRVGDALGDVYIYGGSFGKLFDVNPDAGSNQGDIFLFGGKFAIDPRTYTNAGTTNPSGNTRFIIGEGYSVKDNTDEDKDEYPYIVSKD